MSHSSTVLAGLTAFVVRESERLGADREELLRRAGLSEEDVRDPDRRVQVRKDVRLWLAVLELLPAPDLGIRLARRLELRDLGLVGYLMLHSPVLGDALERLTRFSRILDETYPPTLQLRGNLALYSSNPVAQPVARMDRIADWELAGVLTLARRLVGESFVPVEVRFPYPSPADLAAHREFFRAPLVFERERLEIVFRRDDLSLPVSSADPELGRYLENHAESVVASLTSGGSILDKVEWALWAGLKNGNSSLADVARGLAMSPRSLQRSLKQEGTTFAEQRDALRRELAISLLRERRLAVYEVAFLLGYSEPSTFHRAFKRWTQTSPRRFRDEFGQPSAAATP